MATVTATGANARRLRRANSAEEKSQRRDEIMVGAKQVFARTGFHATTIADIAKEAGLSYGSVYWYFDSKDALFHALMEAEERALREHLTGAITSEDITVDDLFRTAVQSTFEFFEADRATVKLLFRDALAFGDRFEKHLGGIYERFIDDIEAVISVAREQGKIVDVPPRMLAFTLAALVGQLAHRRLTTDDGVPAAKVADFVVTLVLDGLRPRTPPRPNPRRKRS